MAVQGIDQALVDAGHALFDVKAPAEAAYADTTPVHVDITRGEAFNLRGAVRAAIQPFLENVTGAEQYGFVPTEEEAFDTSEALRQLVNIDAKLAVVADPADFPQDDLATLGDLLSI